MKKLIFLVFFISFSTALLSQSKKVFVGWGYGFGISNIHNHTHLKNRHKTIPSSSSFFNIDYSWKEKNSISIGFGIDQRGGRYISNDIKFTDHPSGGLLLQDTISVKNKNDFAYFTFPLTYNHHIPISKNYGLSLGIGGYYSKLIDQRVDREFHNFFALIEQGSFDLEYKEWDTGFVMKAGISRSLGKIIGIEFSCNYLQGVSNFIANSGINKAYHQRFFGQAKIYCHLKRLRK